MALDRREYSTWNKGDLGTKVTNGESWVFEIIKGFDKPFKQFHCLVDWSPENAELKLVVKL